MYLWDEGNTKVLWTAGHMIYCLEDMLKYEWTHIMEVFMCYKTRQIFRNVNDHESFFQCTIKVHKLLQKIKSHG